VAKKAFTVYFALFTVYVEGGVCLKTSYGGRGVRWKLQNTFI